MRTRTLLALLLTLNPILALADFKVHEWGTFTSLLGSDGASQDGMYHEDEELPDFVYNFGEIQPASGLENLLNPVWERIPCDSEHDKGCIPRRFLSENRITQKMETPVVYFYNETGRSVRATVDVRFPEGLISQTFPAPISTFPNRDSEPVLASGHTVFNVEVSPLRGRAVDLPIVPAGNIYGHARNVDSNPIRSGSDREQFIFYRGLGRFQPITQITSDHEGLRIRQPIGAGDIPAAFLVHVDNHGKHVMRYLGAIRAGGEARVSVNQLDNLAQPTKRTPAGQGGHELVKALDAAGLHSDEAQAMVDTWRHGYLATPGLRVLYILPRQEVESILPLRVNASVPVDELERVFVGRIEVLLHSEEQRILKDFLGLGERFDPTSLGRMAEPTLRRIREVYVGSYKPRDDVLARFDRMIQSVSNR